MKRIGFLSFVILAMLVFTLAFSAAASPKAPAAGVAAAPAPVPPHPRVENALAALHSAREHMEHAEGEFHGHRDKAIEHIDAAIHEAEICTHEP